MNARPTPPRNRRRAAAALIVAVLALATGTRTAAQERVAVLPEPGGTAVGVALVIGPAGPAADRTVGAAHVAAAAIAERLRPRLDALGARLRLECSRSGLRYTLLAPPATWWVAADLLFEFVFHQPPGDRAITAARTRVAERLRGEEANPEQLAERALDEAAFDADRPPRQTLCGRAASVEALDREQVLRARAGFAPARASAAVAGPVDAGRAHRLLAATLGDTERPVQLGRSAPAPVPGRRLLERNTVTTWTGLAFPLPDDVDRDAARLLAFYLREAFAPAAVRPAIVGVGADVEHANGTGLLVLRLLTEPDVADRWTDAVRERIERLAAEPLSGAGFAALVRRYRGALLLGLAAPEDRAREAASQAFHHHGYRDLAPALDALTAERLRRAAAALGEPAVARLGPE